MNVLWTRRADGDMLSARSRSWALQASGLRGIAAARQVHGHQVALVGEPVVGYAVSREADGLATALPGIGAAVHVADCLPVALGGPDAVAMLHCGWRGLAGGIIAEGVRALSALGAGGALEARIGPGAGGCCYEAGPEVHAAFGGRASRGANVDLKAEARTQLAGAGVEQVDDIGVCTLCGGDVFSHRRGDHERMAGIAWL
ncbi:MAG: polyphenol oxidase family protein [Solirubrobacteraceae bacterium]